MANALRVETVALPCRLDCSRGKLKPLLNCGVNVVGLTILARRRSNIVSQLRCKNFV